MAKFAWKTSAITDSVFIHFSLLPPTSATPDEVLREGDQGGGNRAWANPWTNFSIKKKKKKNLGKCRAFVLYFSVVRVSLRHL